MDKQNVRLANHIETGSKKLRVLGKYGHGHGSNPPTVSMYYLLLQKPAEATGEDMCRDLF